MAHGKWKFHTTIIRRGRVRFAFLISILALSGCAGTPLSPSIERVLAFGDSNIDNGNLLRMTAGMAPEPPRWRGRESNGPVVVEYLAENLGVPLESYGVSGATTGTGNIISLLDPRFVMRFREIERTGLLSQVERFTQSGEGLGGSDLVIIWAGSNDLVRPIPYPENEITSRIGAAGNNIANAITKLHQAGARRFVVANRTPRDDLGGNNNRRGIALNVAISHAIARTESLPGINIQLYDAYHAVLDMMRYPTLYGFVEVSAWCIEIADCASEQYETGQRLANSFINWDGGHKTTRVHRVMAAQIARLVSPGTTHALARPVR